MEVSIKRKATYPKGSNWPMLNRETTMVDPSKNPRRMTKRNEVKSVRLPFIADLMLATIVVGIGYENRHSLGNFYFEAYV